MPKIRITLVAALARNRAIGRRGGLPWHLPGDLAHFRRATLGKPLIAGRKTFDGLAAPLPQREMIVVSRRGLEAEGVRAVASPQAALALGRERALALGVGEVCIIGGGELFAALLPAADAMVLTRVEAEPRADAWFPEFRAEDWREVAFTRPVPHPKDECRYVFSVLRRAG